jgi:hypothetical protein
MRRFTFRNVIACTVTRIIDAFLIRTDQVQTIMIHQTDKDLLIELIRFEEFEGCNTFYFFVFQNSKENLDELKALLNDIGNTGENALATVSIWEGKIK